MNSSAAISSTDQQSNAPQGSKTAQNQTISHRITIKDMVAAL
jgi:hypothetical protein